jgi:hypothetical protein
VAGFDHKVMDVRRNVTSESCLDDAMEDVRFVAAGADV